MLFYQGSTLKNSHDIPRFFKNNFTISQNKALPSLRPRASLPLIRPWISLSLCWGVLSKMAHITVNTSIKLLFNYYSKYWFWDIDFIFIKNVSKFYSDLRFNFFLCARAIGLPYNKERFIYYRKSVLHLLKHMCYVHLSRCSTDLR